MHLSTQLVNREPNKEAVLVGSHTDLGGVWVLDSTLMTLEFLSWVIPWKKGLCHPQESHNGLSTRELGKKHFKQLLPQTSACL